MSARPTGPATAYIDAVTTTALLGTDRAGGLPKLAPPGRLAARVSALPVADKEAGLLELAALLSPWARAGAAPVQAHAAAHACAPETLPPCTSAGAALMMRILNGERKDCLGEWLRLARANGVRVREDALPQLLSAAQASREVRADALAVIGERGRWLASLNPEWSFAAGAPAPTDAEDAWQTGTRDQRIALLLDLRQSDPVLAMSLLQSTWATDPPEDRAAFIPALAVNLSAADEPFLESVLDDKRKPVRAAAAELLTQLPDSALVRRMTERARPLLAYDPGKKGGVLRKGAAPRIAVNLPELFDKSMARDGIEQKPPHGMGERAWWLHEIVSRVPPSVWAEQWEGDAASLIAAEVEDRNDRLLHGAWAAAAGRAGDVEWLAALMAADPPEDSKEWAGAPGFMRLPRELQESVASRVLTGVESPVRLLAWLSLSMRSPWSEPFSRSALRALTAGMQDRSKHLKRHLDSALWSLPPLVHASCAADLAELITAAHADRAVTTDPTRQLALLEFRAEIHREFAS